MEQPKRGEGEGGVQSEVEQRHLRWVLERRFQQSAERLGQGTSSGMRRASHWAWPSTMWCQEPGLALCHPLLALEKSLWWATGLASIRPTLSLN